MPGFDHLPSPPAEHDNQLTAARNSRYGLVLFTLYALLYAGYMLISAFQPALMDVVPFGGVNLATLYGLGLIAAALFLALVYGWLCRTSVPTREDRA